MPSVRFRAKWSFRSVGIAAAMVALVTSACVRPAPPPPPPPPPATIAVAAPSVVAEMNTRRPAAPLAVNGSLTDLAAEWANHLASTGVLAHRDLNGIGGWPHLGETIAQASCGISDAVVVNLWLASPPHAATMLSPVFTQAGVARACAPDGREWIVANFGG